MAMKVPEEFVDAALGAGWGGKYPEIRYRVDAALEAVLPKVRERLLSDRGIDGAVQRMAMLSSVSGDPDASTDPDDYVATLIQAAFDHAFPDEPTSLGSPDVNAEHPTQTVHIELEREEVRAVIERIDSIVGSAGIYGSARDKLRAALSSSPEQGDAGAQGKLEEAEKALEVAEAFLDAERKDPGKVARAEEFAAGLLAGQERAAFKLEALLKAVEPFTVDGGVGCGAEEVDVLVETYERIVDGNLASQEQEGMNIPLYRRAAREAIVHELRSHPAARWDRFIKYGGMVRVYGWLDRDDGRSDFLLLDFDAASGELRDWITSAHPHPASVVERLESDSSVECQRVEDHFSVLNAVRLAEKRPQSPALDHPEDR